MRSPAALSNGTSITVCYYSGLSPKGSLYEMAKKPSMEASNAARDLRDLTKRAQQEPGVSQVLLLLEQAQATEQAIRDMAPATEHFVGGTFSHTS